MKKVFVMALVFAATLLGAAEKNLLPGKWKIYGKNTADQTTVIQKNGQIDCTVRNNKGISGVVRYMTFAKPLTGSITFGAESKAENVKGATSCNYSIYLDITFADGKMLYGKVAPFKNGTYNWTKSSATVKLPKPVKRISYYVLFRKATGKVSFRNIFLYNK